MMDSFFKRMETKDFRGKRSKNSDQFNNMMDVYEQTISKIGNDKTNEEKLSALRELKAAAAEYVNAKRAQKGHPTNKILNSEVDLMMMGKSKEKGASIFTGKGRDRYEFAIKLITNIKFLEKEYGELAKQKDANEINHPEQGEIENIDMDFQDMEIDTSTM